MQLFLAMALKITYRSGLRQLNERETHTDRQTETYDIQTYREEYRDRPRETQTDRFVTYVPIYGQSEYGCFNATETPQRLYMSSTP